MSRRWRRSAEENLRPDEDFWSYVDKTTGPIHPVFGRCWVWKGGRSSRDGYGVWRGKRAHRVSLERSRGEPLGKLHSIHRCDNPPCVRPDHLFPGTHADNMTDGLIKGRFARSTEWIRAHSGEASGNCRLSDKAVVKIRAAKRAGATDRELADRFGTTVSYVIRIVSGRARRASMENTSRGA